MSSSPTAVAADHLARLTRVAPASGHAVRPGLLDALSQVPDPRDRRGVRYAFTAILAVAVCATLAGARSYSAIAERAGDAPPQVRAALGLPGPAPDLVTIWRVLTAVDPAALDRATGSWVTAQLAEACPGPVRAVLLSTWLGHVDPKSTYCYLQAVPELLAQAAGRLERRSRAGRPPGDRPRPHPPGVLHRPAGPAEAGQPEHGRGLPGHMQAPARVRAGADRKAPSRLSLADLDATLIGAFLQHWTAPVILEALIPGRMRSHACTAEVSRGAA